MGAIENINKLLGVAGSNPATLNSVNGISVEDKPINAAARSIISSAANIQISVYRTYRGINSDLYSDFLFFPWIGEIIGDHVVGYRGEVGVGVQDHVVMGGGQGVAFV